MDSGQFEYFVLQNTHCALQIDRNDVLLLAHHHTDLAENSLNKGRLSYLFVDCGRRAVENDVVGLCEV